MRRTFLLRFCVQEELILLFSVISAASPHQFVATAHYMRRSCGASHFFTVVVVVVAVPAVDFVDYSVFARLPFGQQAQFQ